MWTLNGRLYNCAGRKCILRGLCEELQHGKGLKITISFWPQEPDSSGRGTPRSPWESACRKEPSWPRSPGLTCDTRRNAHSGERPAGESLFASRDQTGMVSTL